MTGIEHVLANEQDAIRCPYLYYARVRAAGPVVYDPAHDVFIVSRHADIEKVNAQPQLFSNRNPMGPTVSSAVAAMQRVLGQAAPEFAAKAAVVMSRGRVLFVADPPQHSRHRKLLNRALTPRAISLIADDIRRICHELVDAFPDAGSVDLCSAFASPAPIHALALLLYVPNTRGSDFARWTAAINASIGTTMSDAQILATISEQMEFWDFFEAELRRRQARPGADLLSAIVRSHEDSGETPLTMDEMVGFCSQLIGAGADTTTKLISAAMLQLCRDPALMRRLRDDPALIPIFLEESLRYDAPVQGLFRVATADTELGGVRIPAGAHVWVVYGSGNHDETVFDRADRLDIDRPGLRHHLAFGSGPHHCIGASLARAVARTGFEVLLARLAAIELADSTFVPTYDPSYIMHGMQSLPLVVRKAH